MRSVIVSATALAMGAMASPASKSVDSASATFFQAGSAMTNFPGFDPSEDISVNVVNADSCKTTFHVVASVEQVGQQTVSDQSDVECAPR